MAISCCGKRLLSMRNAMCKIPKRESGYIILLPEIGDDLPDKNSLLRPNNFPEFNTFSVERVFAAVGKLSVLFEDGIQNIEAKIEGNQSIDIVVDVINAIEELNLPLETCWGVANTLYFGNQILMPQKYYEYIHERMIKAQSVRFISKPLYEVFKAAHHNKDLNLTAEQRRIVACYALEGRLNGLDLVKKFDVARFGFLTQKVYKLRAEIQEKIGVSTRSFKSIIKNPNIVRDFPDDFLKTIAADPKKPNEGPWTITLYPDCISRFLEYCPDRELRRIAWTAKVERCAMVGDPQLRTSSQLETLRDNRIEQAKMVGYKSFSHMSMETKIAGSLENIYSVMDDLLTIARPIQEKEMKELTEFAYDRGFEKDIIRQWDIDYWIRKHRRSTLNFKDEILHEYFPLPHVLKGLFQLIENLYDIRIVEGTKKDVWHTDVRFFDVIDLTQNSEVPIAHFYIDPYARGDSKVTRAQGSAWMVSMRHRSKLLSETPLVALIFNFRSPIDNKPSLLSFKDVANLFEKVGSALQYLLTRVNYSELAGAKNLEWDATGVTGYFMENWLYEPQVIQSITSHYKTNESLPNDLVESIRKIRSHMAGYRLCETLYYGRFDLELHDSEEFWVPMVKRLWKKHFVIPHSKFDSSITSWGDIFCGNWAASWYSHLWSQMLAADAYSAFKESPKNDSIQQKEISMRFRNTFLELGGSVSGSEIFRRFRGRDPNSEALLENMGLQSINNDV